MRNSLAGAVRVAGLATAANASPTSVTAVDIGAWNAITADAHVTEVVETLGNETGAGAVGGPLDTAVGRFEAFGASGGAGTCRALTGTSSCGSLALSDFPTFGQGNTVPEDGRWSLN